MGFVKKNLKWADGRWIGQKVLGNKTMASIDLAGQLIKDPTYDSLYKPTDVQPIPTTDTDTAGFTARDTMRRLAKKASGRDSTIRTSPAGATLYSAQPKSLLGS